MATIGLSDIRKSYGSTEVLHGISAQIADGELIVVVGPSGCGKSTLLRMVAGLETISSGTISIDGRTVNDLEPRERDIAMVFQNYALYPHMSVRANLAYGLKIAGKSRTEIAERIGDAAKLLQLEPYLDRKPRQLSGGQRQRVAMGRAIVREPAVFLFDEPLSNLDAKLRVQMRMEIKALQRELGVTAIYVTHDQVEAMTLADRMIVMRDGVAEQIGAPLEVYQSPASRFVADFIGSPPMNFLPVEVINGSMLGSDIPGSVEVGVRPEHLRHCAPEAALVKGTLTFREALGAETLLHIHVPRTGGTEPRTIVVRADSRGPALEDGAQINLTADTSDLVWFDAEGKSLSTGVPSDTS